MTTEPSTVLDCRCAPPIDSLEALKGQTSLAATVSGENMRQWMRLKRDEYLRRHQTILCRDEWATQHFSALNERPVEYAFVFRSLATLYPRDVLDVGTGTTALPALMRTCGFVVTAVDNVNDYWPTGMTNRHYHVMHEDITDPTLEDASFDLITCVSVLEHIRDADAAVASMLRLVRPGGHLILTFPYTETQYVRNVYALPGSTYGQNFAYETQSFSRAELDRWFAEETATIVEQEYWEFWTGGYWTVGERVTPPRSVRPDEPHQITCLLIHKV